MFHLFLLSFLSAFCDSPNTVPDLQRKIDSIFLEAENLARDPKIIAALVASNSDRQPAAVKMTNEKWKGLSVRDPFVKAFATNPIAEVIRKNVKPYVSEAFISKVDGTKVAFLQKTSNWSHKGKPKHDVPMSGKRWQGTLELDESTGLNQIQIAVPIYDGAKPIGSLVLGIAVAKL